MVFRKAYGNRAVEPFAEPMTVDTVFDVASLTKPVATATSVMILIEEGKLLLSDPVVRFIPEFAAGGGDRAKVTIEHLFTHRAGFPPDDPLDLYTGTPDEIFARKYQQPLASAPGARFVYSDVGYEVLGEIVRRVSGERLDRFAEDHIFRPLAMKDTRFNRLPREGGVRAPPYRRVPVFPPTALPRPSTAATTGCAARSTTRAPTPWAASRATPASSRPPRTSRSSAG